MTASPASHDSERRTAKRYLALVVARLRRGGSGSERTALTRDISVSGALLLTRANLQLGEEIELALMLGADDSALQVPGRVVRVDTLTASERQLWAAKAAVAFGQSIEASEPELAAIARAQQQQAPRASESG